MYKLKEHCIFCLIPLKTLHLIQLTNYILFNQIDELPIERGDRRQQSTNSNSSVLTNESNLTDILSNHTNLSQVILI